jgi:hypothetical protein
MGNSNVYCHQSCPIRITSSKINIGLCKQEFDCDEKSAKVEQYLSSLSSVLTKTECQRIANRITKQKQGESFSEIITFQSAGSASRTIINISSKKDKLKLHVIYQGIVVNVTFDAVSWHLKNAHILSSKPRALTLAEITKLTSYLKQQCENVIITQNESEADVCFRDNSTTKTKVLFGQNIKNCSHQVTFAAQFPTQIKSIQLGKNGKLILPKKNLTLAYTQKK